MLEERVFDFPPQTEVTGPVLDLGPFLSPNLGEGSERMKRCRHEDTCGDDDDGIFLGPVDRK